MNQRIGFVSTRFAGTDGVSLEAAKWAEVLEQEGHECYWFAGELDRDPIVINRYDIFISDIEPLGFEFISLDGYLTPSVVNAAREILQAETPSNSAQENNYAIAKRYFSYSILRRRLQSLMDNFDMEAPSQQTPYAAGQMAPCAQPVPMRMAV